MTYNVLSGTLSLYTTTTTPDIVLFTYYGIRNNKQPSQQQLNSY